MRKVLSLLAFCLLSISATCQTPQHSAALTWGSAGVTGATYNVLRGSVPGGPKTTVQTGVTALTFTDSNLTGNTQYCYQVTTSVSGMSDSTPTNEVCGTTGKDQAPAPGTLLVIFK